MPLPHRPRLTPARIAVRTILLIVAIAAASLLYLTVIGPRAGLPRSITNKSVTLYSSADDEVLRAVVEAFQAETGLEVRVVTDTEATKTTGLVQRLLDERSQPRADVWWSSEPLGTIRLGRERVIEPYNLPLSVAEGRPAESVYGGGLWYTLASRARVIAYSTTRVRPDQIPRTLRDLTDPKWKGRVGMARPQFGTTRAHLAALVALAGKDRARAWLSAMKANGVRIYPGNSSVVRAIAQGEIDAGLTDTDDVWSAQRNNWDVGVIYETPDLPSATLKPDDLPSFGALVLPNTVAKVRDDPSPRNAARLLDFLLGPKVERTIAASDSRNVPVRPAVAAEFPALAIPTPWTPDLEQVGAAVNDAMAIASEVLGT